MFAPPAGDISFPATQAIQPAPLQRNTSILSRTQAYDNFRYLP